MRYTPDGTPVCNLSVATSTKIKKEGSNGQRPCPDGWKESYNGKYWELTTWLRLTCWRGLAETVNQYVTKGTQVYFEGELRGEASEGTQNPRVWTGDDGQPRASFEITARTVKFLGGGNGGSSSEPAEPPRDFEEDELPF
jgi:single-strand DNA-binding protein